MEIKLTNLQLELISKAAQDKEAAENKLNEVLDLIFAYHRIPKPTQPLSLNDGKLVWSDPVPETIEG